MRRTKVVSSAAKPRGGRRWATTAEVQNAGGRRMVHTGAGRQGKCDVSTNCAGEIANGAHAANITVGNL